MEKEFVTYEQAIKLKELGFKEICFAYFRKDLNGKFICSIDGMVNINDKQKFMTSDENGLINHEARVSYISAPLKQQVFRWFRNNHKLQAEILWRGDMSCFCYKTGNFKYSSHSFSKDDYKTYEEAESACIDKLIELIENKNI